MLKVITACIALAALTVAGRTTSWKELTPSFSYEQYLIEQGKLELRRDQGEMEMRRALFQAELKAVIAHNNDKTKLYKRGLNQFSDMTAEERQAQYLLKDEFRDVPIANGHPLHQQVPLRRSEQRNQHILQGNNAARVKSVAGGRLAFDWREITSPTNVVSTVKDQGICGSCWAHGTTEAIESAVAIQDGKSFVMSQQQFVSCVPNITATMKTADNKTMTNTFGGCRGYLPHLAMDWLANSAEFHHGGLVQEWENPYRSYWDQVPPSYNATYPVIRGPRCEKWMSKINPVANVTGHTFVTPNDEDAMEEAIVNNGPVAILMAVYPSFESYEAGVYHSEECEGKKGVMPPSHITNLVGFGYDAGLDAHYWILRNSWSATWGDRGYARMLRNETSMNCGQMMMPHDLNNVTSNWGPVKSCGMCGILNYAAQPKIGKLSLV